MKDKLELHLTPSKQSNSPDRRRKSSRRSASTKKKGRIDSNSPSEQKYIGIRQYHSDNWKRDNKGKFRTVSMATKGEYLGSGDAKEILLTKGNIDTLYELAKTRDIKKSEMLLRFGVKKTSMGSTRNEAIAKFATGWTGKLPHNFKRYGVEVAKNKRVAEPRPNSSQGKVGTTTVSGAKEFNKDYKAFAKSLLKLFKLDKGKAKKLAKGLSKKVNITVKG